MVSVLLRQYVTTAKALSDSRTPSFKALQWLVEEDPAKLTTRYERLQELDPSIFSCRTSFCFLELSKMDSQRPLTSVCFLELSKMDSQRPLADQQARAAGMVLSITYQRPILSVVAL
jgi:hypothetical protein